MVLEIEKYANFNPMQIVYKNGSVEPIVLGDVSYLYNDEIDYEKTRQTLTGKYIFLHLSIKWSLQAGKIYNRLWKRTILYYIYYIMFVVKQYNIGLSVSFLGGEWFDTLLLSSFHLFRKNDVLFIGTGATMEDDIRFLHEFYSSCILSSREKKAIFIVLVKHVNPITGEISY